MSVYVIVPARGGSKGIPGKNLRPVGGIPLVVRTVAAALDARRVDRVFVSTDDEQIAATARAAGAEVIERPAALAGDEASSESALVHALDTLVGQGVADPDIVVMMQCTSPFTTADDVDRTVALVDDGADAAFTAAPSAVFLWRDSPAGATGVNHDASVRPRRQEREPEFAETGAVYAMRTAGFRTAAHRFFGRIAICEVPIARAGEIDEPDDLVLADALAESLPAAGARPGLGLPAVVVGLALDFDGVLTDNRVMTLQDGTEAVLSDRSDGLGIEMLRASGLPMVVLSKERNPVVTARCAKLSLDYVQSVDDKVGAFSEWIAAHDLDREHVVFVGNDVNDVECLRAAGCGVVVADATPEARAAADLVLTHRGGRGAVRELADLILKPTSS